MTYNNVMIDVETTGLSPDRAGILQIAAVKFDLETQSVCSENMFDRCTHLLAGRTWEEGTREFWYGRNRPVLETLLPRRELPRPVFNSFADWLYQDIDPGKPLHVWAKPIHFDWPMVDSHFKQLDMVMHAHFRAAIDMNSYIRGMFQNVDAPLDFYRPDGAMEGMQHNALIDCIWQIQNLFEAVKTFKRGPEPDA